MFNLNCPSKLFSVNFSRSTIFSSHILPSFELLNLTFYHNPHNKEFKAFHIPSIKKIRIQ